MTDEKMDFLSDVSKKSITAKSSRYKNGRASSKNFNKYSESECRKKNSPTLEYNVPIPLEQLKQYPVNMQRDYIFDLVHRYNTHYGSFAELFKIRIKAVYAYFKEIGIETYEVNGDFDEEGWKTFLKMEVFPHKPICWGQFKNLEKHKRKMYIEWLVERFNVNGAKHFAKVFGVSEKTIYDYFSKECGYSFAGNKGKKASKENVSALYSFFEMNDDSLDPVNKESYEDAVSIDDVSMHPNALAPIVFSNPDEKEKGRKPVFAPSNFSAEYSGSINLSDLFDSMKYFFGESIKGKIIITIEREETKND